MSELDSLSDCEDSPLQEMKHKDKKKQGKQKKEKRSKEKMKSKQPKSSNGKHEKDEFGIRVKKLEKCVKELFRVFEDDVEELRSIFRSLDEGEDIDITEIENKEIQLRLANLFDILKLKQKTGVMSFRKPSNSSLLLASYMEKFIHSASSKRHASVKAKRNVSERKYSSRSSSSSLEFNEKDKYEPKISKRQNSDKQILSPVKSIISVDNNVVNRDEWLMSDGLDSFLQNSFKEVQASEIKQYLTRNENRISGPSFKTHQLPNKLDESRLAEGSAPLDLENLTNEDEDDTGIVMKISGKDRSKTLMQIHQENLQKKKMESPKFEQTRRSFDREQDLFRKPDSKKLFAALKDSFEHGPKFLRPSGK